MYDYIHGGNFKSYMKKFNIKSGEITDLSVNVNPLGLPSVLEINKEKLTNNISKYPSYFGDGVLEFYEEKFGISPDRIVVGNGSMELIYLAPQALGIKSVLIAEPSFYDYRRSFEIANCKIYSIYLKENNNFKLIFDKEFTDKLSRLDAVIIGRPNNPTGNLPNKEEILKIARNNRNKWFLIDETFIQFTYNFAKNTLMYCDADNILIFHSLTKFYAVPGLRIGAVIGSKEATDRFRAVKHPWSVNVVAENAASMLIVCDEYEKNTAKLIKKEKAKIEKFLRKEKNLKLFPSYANFFLAKWIDGADMNKFLQYVLKHGIFVRDCRNFKGLNGNFFRFAVSNEKNNDKFIKLLIEYGQLL